MGTMKSAVNTLLYQLPFKAEVLDKFPGYFTYSGEMTYLSYDVLYGFRYTFESTGSRVGALDYSGSYQLDQHLNSSSYAFMLYFRLNEDDLQIFIGSDFGFKSTDYSYSESFQLTGLEEESDSSEDKFQNLYFLPGFRLAYPYSSFVFSANINLHFGFENSSIESMMAHEWNGLRIGLSASYILFGQNK